jgi:hypothetical protein
METDGLVVKTAVHCGPSNTLIVTKYENNYWEVTDIVVSKPTGRWAAVIKTKPFKAAAAAVSYLGVNMTENGARKRGGVMRRFVHDAVFGAFLKAFGYADDQLNAHVNDAKYIAAAPAAPLPLPVVVAPPIESPANIQTYEVGTVRVEVNMDTSMLNATKLLHEHGKTVSQTLKCFADLNVFEHQYFDTHGKTFEGGTHNDLVNQSVVEIGGVHWMKCELLHDVLLVCNHQYYRLARRIMMMYTTDKIGLAAKLVQEDAASRGMYSTMVINTTKDKGAYDEEVARLQSLLQIANDKNTELVAKSTGKLWEAQHLIPYAARVGCSQEDAFQDAVSAITTKLSILKRIETHLPRTLEVAERVGFDAVENMVTDQSPAACWVVNDALRVRDLAVSRADAAQQLQMQAAEECKLMTAEMANMAGDITDARETIALLEGRISAAGLADDEDGAPQKKPARKPRSKKAAAPAAPAPAPSGYQPPAVIHSPFLHHMEPFMLERKEYDAEAPALLRDARRRSPGYANEAPPCDAIDALVPAARGGVAGRVYIYERPPTATVPFLYNALLARPAAAPASPWRLVGHFNMTPDRPSSAYIDAFINAQYATPAAGRIYESRVANSSDHIIWQMRRSSQLEHAWHALFGAAVIDRTNVAGVAHSRGEWLLQ